MIIVDIYIDEPCQYRAKSQGIFPNNVLMCYMWARDKTVFLEQ